LGAFLEIQKQLAKALVLRTIKSVIVDQDNIGSLQGFMNFWRFKKVSLSDANIATGKLPCPKKKKGRQANKILLVTHVKGMMPINTNPLHCTAPHRTTTPVFFFYRSLCFLTSYELHILSAEAWLIYMVFP
jgi:hypothetical protein